MIPTPPPLFPFGTKVDKRGDFVEDRLELWVFDKPVRNLRFINSARFLINGHFEFISLSEGLAGLTFKIYDVYTLGEVGEYGGDTAEVIRYLTKKMQELTLCFTLTLKQQEFKGNREGIMAGDDGYFPLNNFWEHNSKNPLNGAYKTPQFREKQYLSAVSKLTDINRVDKLDAF